MDKNALTEKRRETVISLLKGMRIRKNTEEGFDKEDVYTCIQQLCDLYETHIEELEKHYEVELAEITERCSKYDEKSLQYADIMMSAQKYHDDMVKQTNDEVYELMANAQKQYEEQQLQIEDLRIAFESEKAALDEELDAAKNMAEAKKDAMRAEVEAEKEKLDAIKLRYRQQIDAMEEEFQEIRTNILRTATSLNGLKSQVNMADEGQWTVAESDGAVEFPTSDSGVEEILDFPIEELEQEFASTMTEEAKFEDAVEEETSAEEDAAEEETSEQTIEGLPATDELFAETFFKSEIMENIGVPAEESTPEVPMEEEDVESTSEPASQEPAKIKADIEEMLEKVSFEDIFADLPEADKADDAPVDEISLEGIEEINLEDFEDIKLDDTVELEAGIVEEISLENLTAIETEADVAEGVDVAEEADVEKEVDQEATAQLAAGVAAAVAEEIDASTDAVAMDVSADPAEMDASADPVAAVAMDVSADLAEMEASTDPAEETKGSAIPAEEISFEGLEALFKDE